MLCDKAQFEVIAGKGGDGIVSFHRAKFQPKGGPDGGNGGKGGDVIIKASKSSADLVDYISRRQFKAEDGKPGGQNERTGASGDNLVLSVPVGVEVYKVTPGSKKLLADLKKAGDKVLVAKGGKPGKGNSEFKSSTNQAPREQTDGEPGEQEELFLKLKLLTDIGFIGKPNAGKSTLLSVVSRAKPKIADYPFTTTSPNLGVIEHKQVKLVAADIPGLIKDAYKGKGLGDQFLAHIERCRLLVHLVDASSEDVVKDYLMIRKELELYGHNLVSKPEIVVLNKIDIIDDSNLKKKKAKLEEKVGGLVIAISAETKDGVSEMLNLVIKRFQDLTSK
jgi:GTP-binding protein